jgi:hypothetical protein
MRFATQAMGRFTFDNSHGDMGTVMLSLQGAPAGVVAEGQVYTIVESPAGNITGAFKNLPDGAILAALTTGQEFTINYTSHAITLTAAPIPEPSTYALLGGVGALALVLVSRWRRHRV